MRSSKNLLHNLQFRQENQNRSIHFQRQFYSNNDLIYRLSLCAELQGHAGCVNCLQWNDRGTILASGSDDYRVILWDPFSRKKLRSIETGHVNNIFSVQFSPGSGDRIIITGAGDSKVKVHDINNTSGECLQNYSCHFARVKRLAVAQDEPNLVWSAAEDGLVMQYDLREAATCKNVCKHVLINLNSHMGAEAEIKCLSINPCRTELMAVGANDPYVRVYDRRMLTLKSIKTQPTDRYMWDRSSSLLTLSLENENYNFPPAAVQYYIAGAYAANPYEFTLNKATSVQLECNGTLYPSQPYAPKLSWLEPYINSLKIVNKLYADTNTGLDIDDYIPNGHQALVFDLSVTESGTADYTSPKQNGILSISASWEANDIISNYSLIFYQQWDSEIAIDGRKNIILNYIP